MGTNYYVRFDPCTACGHAEIEYHIGKSSAGWCFALHVDPVKSIESLNDIELLLIDNPIYDEYDQLITVEDMQKIITMRGAGPPYKRQAPFGYESWADFHVQNDSMPGPNNLLRHKIGTNCIGHGDGTWDLITGEFS